jgi:hypothetical protein
MVSLEVRVSERTDWSLLLREKWGLAKGFETRCDGHHSKREFRNRAGSQGKESCAPSRNDRILIVLAAVCSQLRHDAVNDWIGDAMRQLKGTTFGHDLHSLTTRIT